MAGFVQNIIWNSVGGFVEAGKKAAGGYAGDALIKAGDMIESSGRNVGTGIERRASGYGTAISGQTYQPSAKALPSTARRPAAKRSSSSPAITSTKAPSKAPGASKQPGAKQVASSLGTGKKQVTSGSTGTRGPIGGAGKGAVGIAGGASKAVGNTTGSATKALPKPYPSQGSAVSKGSSLSKPYSNPSGNSYPSNVKTAVRPGQPKPFKAEEKAEPKPGQKAYPGTNMLPGQGSKTPVKPQKYKPMERLAPPAEKGKVQHISV